ncbi:p48 [Ewingella americana]|uniref:p48 n=1 Tax=Ewingella americana TaxID=41202 RepID=A0A377NH79_9GAMM|nr:p48 [Ewingella americana]
MQVQDVNRLLKQFDDMQRMMKKMKKGGMAKMMRGMKGMMHRVSQAVNQHNWLVSSQLPHSGK